MSLVPVTRQDGQKMLVNPDHIVSAEPTRSGTIIHFITGAGVNVLERPLEIDRLEQMP